MRRRLLGLLFCLSAALYLHATVVEARPCYGDMYKFFDSSVCDNEVGEFGLACDGGGFQWGTVNTPYYEEFDYCCGNEDCTGDDDCGGFGDVLVCDIGTCDAAHNSAAVVGGMCNFYHF